VLLILLGLVLNLEIAAPHFSAVRIPGVLQRLSLAYLGAALVVRSTGVATQAAIAVALMAGHWALMTLVPVGGVAGAAFITRNHNLAGVIDAYVFGSHTLLPGFDPEGLLGTLPTISTALLGALAGQWLRRNADHRRQLAGLVAGGAAAIALGLAWSTVWPINKPLWTGSYALLMSGLAAAALAACLFVVDIAGVRGWARPFLALGVNRWPSTLDRSSPDTARPTEGFDLLGRVRQSRRRHRRRMGFAALRRGLCRLRSRSRSSSTAAIRIRV
jgi:predicted acyltransferase